MIKGNFFGYLNPSSVEFNPSALRAMADSGKANLVGNPKHALHCDFNEYQTGSNDVRAVLIGRPDWSHKQLASIAKETSDPKALLLGWKEHGPNILRFLRNHFALAIVDTKCQEVFLAIDRLGVGSLYYSISHTGSIIFGSQIAYIHGHPEIRKSINKQGLFNYLYFHMVPSPGSIYADIQKLEPAHSIYWRNSNSRKEAYWTPVFNESCDKTINEASEELLKTLEICANDAIVKRPYGAFLSGGIDSSCVSGSLSRVSGNPVDTYTIGFDADGYDEIPFARIAASHFGTRPHEYYVRPEDIVETVTTVGAAYEEPFGNSSALPAYFCAKEAAKEGAQLLIAGDGGDELFAGNERYTKQYVFERYFHFPETIRNRFLEPFSDRFLDSNSALLRKPSSYVAQAKIPLPDRLQTYNFLHRVGDLNLMFTREFLADINLEEPLLLLRNRYSEPEEASILNRMLYLDWKFTLADNDIRKVSGMCNLAGIDVSYPMMDDRLLDLSCEIPSSWKISRGRLRHFFKHACRNFLPQEILNKQKHGFGLPFGVWTSTNPDLQALAYDNVTRLGSRGILNRDFITQAIKLHKDGHAGYYGELIWILMMLELWMKSHEI